MPRGPQGQKRPAGVVGPAVMAAKTAVGEIEEELGPEGPKPGKDAAAADLGKRGGAAPTKALTAEQRREIAKKGAASHWSKPE